jgi:uncharacterized protein YdaU (DUF1376 family)
MPVPGVGKSRSSCLAYTGHPALSSAYGGTMDWYPKNPTHYRNDTWSLSLAGHGAYNLLIDHYMLYEAPLPADDASLASIIGKPLEEWMPVKEEVVKRFTRRGNRLHHKRCNAELNLAYGKRKDGAARQKKYRKHLIPLEGVTHQSHVSNGPTGEERIRKKKTPLWVPPKTPPPKKAVSKMNGKRAIPSDWQPNAASIEIARKEGYDHEQTVWFADQFRDSAAAHGRKYEDWDRAFNGWLRSEYARPSLKQGSGSKGNSIAGAARILARDLE